MKLPIPFLGKPQTNESYYLTLLLSDEKVSAVILLEQNGQVKIIGWKEKFFTKSIEDVSLPDIINLVDKTVTQAEEILPPEVETHKTVFGVKESWVSKETKKIKKDYLAKLKKVCDALDLTPIGFMVISEAIANFLREEEGAPLSAILSEIGKHKATLTLFRGGNIIETVEGEIEGSAAASVDKLLKHFTVEVLPARIIIYDSDTTEEMAQKFIAHNWSKSLPFLHLPQTTVLPHGFDAKSIAHGAAEQMELRLLRDEKTEQVKTYEANTEEIKAPEEEQKPEKTDAESFGFIVGEDIALRGKPEIEPEPESVEEKSAAHQLLHGHTSDNLMMPESKNFETSEKETENMDEEMPKHRKAKRVSPLAGITGLIKKFKLPKIHFRLGGGKVWLFLLPVLILVLLVGGACLFYYYQFKAEVNLTVKPDIVNEETNITFAADKDTDPAKQLISAKKTSIEVEGNVSTEATGTDEVGEEGKGTVTLYNSSTEGETKLASGTTLTSSNGVKFTLDKEVKIASASGDIFSGTKPGTVDVQVTASEIGTEGNLPSGTKFTVSGNSTVAGKNSSAFSGGSKKSVTVISKNDLTNARTQLQENLESKAKEELTQKSSRGEKVLPVVLSNKLEKEKFDKKDGDQAKTVNLVGTVMVTGLVYQEDDLLSLGKDILEKKYKEGVSFAPNSINADLKDFKLKDGEVTAKAQIEAGLLPKINGDELAGKLSGKSMTEAKKTLDDLPQATLSQITYSPSLFFFDKFVPYLPKQVKVVIQSQ